MPPMCCDSKITAASMMVSLFNNAGTYTFMFNNGRHFLLYNAVPAMGAVLHPLNVVLPPNELAFIIGQAQDKVIVVDAKLLPVFGEPKDLPPQLSLPIPRPPSYQEQLRARHDEMRAARQRGLVGPIRSYYGLG